MKHIVLSNQTKIFSIFLTILFAFSCGGTQNEGAVTPGYTLIKDEVKTLERIKELGELNVVVDYNSTSYFVYKGRPMGFQYDLLKAFTEDLGVKLHLSVSNNMAETFNGVARGQYDLVAKNLTVTKERGEVVDFTEPLMLTRQVLVQRKPKDWRKLTYDSVQSVLLLNQLDLADREVHVQKNTVYARRLHNLSDEIGEPIDIVEDSIYGVEQLVGMVAKGEIDYTVCDENVGLVNQRYYPWLDISLPISFQQKLSWAVKKDNESWLAYVNNWIEEFKNTLEYRLIYNKYFKNSRSEFMVRNDYHSLNGSRISPYDNIVKKLTDSTRFDWRMVSSIMYQESRFDTIAESWAGAMGIMQLMPETAERFDVENIYDAEDNITGGVRLLEWLEGVFEPVIEDEAERNKFILASYNVGLGHVMDARSLAKKYGKDPKVWNDNVDYYLLNKSIPKYYRDPVVRWGYCRGEEPYDYVNEVLDRYQHYTNLIVD